MSDARTTRRYVPEASNAISYADTGAQQTIDACRKIIDTLEPWVESESREPGDGQGVLPMEAWDAIRDAYPLARNLERLMPDVMGWCVGYHWGRDGDNTSVWFACKTKAQADRLCDAANKSMSRDNWSVWYGAADHHDLVKRSFSPQDVAALARQIG